MHLRVVGLVVGVMLLIGTLPSPARAAPTCQFALGFATLHGLDPADVGTCLDDQRFVANGDAQQHTTNGLLVWRKQDNWTAFTNGYWTWINGPSGLVKRLNTQRFSWEGNPAGPSTTGAGAPSVAGTPDTPTTVLPAEILMTSNRDSYDDLWVANTDGSNARRLTYDGQDYGARWSPDKSQIVFTHQVPGPGYAHSVIAVMSSDGSNRRTLTQYSTGDRKYDFDPSWSPDGSRILFVRQSQDFQYPQLYTIRPDGTDLHLVTYVKGTKFAPMYSPDGRTIAFYSDDEAGSGLTDNIYAINADGTNLRQLTTSNGAAEYPVWSPDGSRIAFSNIDTRPAGNNARSSEAWRVWEMNADGSNPHVVVTGTYANQERSQNVAAWRGDELLLASYDGHWDIKIAKDDGTIVSTVPLSMKDDKPSDWR